MGVPGAAKMRSYSIASAPHEAHLEFCIELVPGGVLSPRLFALTPGSPVRLGPGGKGSFVLSSSARVHLMVATVTGIAPLRSMLRDAVRGGSRDRFVILHGASYADELAYRRELEDLAARLPQVDYQVTLSRPDEARNRGWSGERGRVDPLAERVAQQLDPAAVQVYACGNSGMIAKVKQQLGARGFRVSSESFD